MSYQLLSSLYYQDKNTYEKEYKKRIDGESTVFFPIDVNENKCFMVLNWEIASLIERIGRNNAIALQAFTMLPKYAKQYYTYKCLLEEIQTTNEIEGIHSTRKEIRKALDTDVNSKKQTRFHGMSKKYEMLLPNKNLYVPLERSNDIRALYDEIVSAEVDGNDKPDGKVFRKSNVTVVSPTQQVRHEGVMPESKIIAMMDHALNILKNDQISILVRIALFHYFFGYIHPFYDGNGRISRFISSYLLKTNDFNMIALDLAHTIKDNRSKYYKAFQISNDKRNRGDVTSFVITFLGFISESSERIAKSVIEGQMTIKHVQEFINKILFNGDRDCAKKRKMMSLFVQSSFFSLEGLSTAEILDYMSISRSTMDKLVSSMIVDRIPIRKQRKGRENRYSLNNSQFLDYIDDF